VLTRTFLDAGVLIAAATGRDALLIRALTVLNDPDRVFVSSVFVRLEVVPKAVYFRRPDEIAFYETFFASTQFVPVSDALLVQAQREASAAGLRALDALHIAAAKASGTEEFITTERPTTALFRVTGLTVTTLRPAS
jgi:predicted nucleic acid-binding protein